MGAITKRFISNVVRQSLDLHSIYATVQTLDDKPLCEAWYGRAALQTFINS